MIMAKITDNGNYKFTAQELKYSIDGGMTWNSYDPPVYRIGDLVGFSTDCVGVAPFPAD